jgi:3-oxoacyl-[acyl-carrier protein] reductase
MAKTSLTFDLKDMIGKDVRKEMELDLLPTHIIDKRVTDLMSLKGKKAVVTGAGGPGLGQACANRLAGLGADVALVDINAERLESNTKQVIERWGTRAFAVPANCTDWDDVHRFMRECHDKLGGIDILVNNVGGSGGPRTFESQNKEQLDRTIGMTLISTVYCTRAVIDYMIPQRSGHIINISSGAGFGPSPHVAVYGACKAGVINLTQSLSSELGRYGIYVNGVAPGLMLHTDTLDKMKTVTEENLGLFEIVLSGKSKFHLGRSSLPEEVANAVAFLASDAASYISGTTISCSPGMG